DMRMILLSTNNDIKHFLNEGLIIDKDTGEILTQKEYHELFSQELTDAIDRYVKSCNITEEAPKLELRTIKNVKQAVVPVKEKYHFNKVFRMDMKDLMLTGNL